MASEDEAASIEERLKSSLWYSIGQFVDEECLQHNLNATPQFIGALTEMVYTQISNTSRDLETFAKHAGRKVVNTDDVMLLSRRNEGLETVLRQALEDIRAKEGRTGEKKRREKFATEGKGKTKR
ncbi:hypothetical protein GQ43DRAFT_437234 [Delitschia confertaspora ATCC 74209]|uniref:Centromere protein S n=1 Tax=Delitschia confertaspora ATCC 74209 TaxID=1513339 RepID=A0A9P4JX95_9PLEO|nr:hypothetical protein GQ43DRAFT_437234 [Delitschia confertaspora ATCC 74209]